VAALHFPAEKNPGQIQRIALCNEPAGTLIHCTLDEPNFSSATADIGDPVICHLSSLREFGHSVFQAAIWLDTSKPTRSQAASSARVPQRLPVLPLALEFARP
jgi:hypothetical protein